MKTELNNIETWDRLHYDFLYRNQRSVISAMRLKGTLPTMKQIRVMIVSGWSCTLQALIAITETRISAKNGLPKSPTLY